MVIFAAFSEDLQYNIGILLSLFPLKNFILNKTIPIFNFCHLFGKDDHALIFALPLLLVILLKILTKPYITLMVEGITFWYRKKAGIIGFIPVILEGTISGGLGVKSYVSRYVPKRQKSSKHMEINVLIFHWSVSTLNRFTLTNSHCQLTFSHPYSQK